MTGFWVVVSNHRTFPVILSDHRESKDPSLTLSTHHASLSTSRTADSTAAPASLIVGADAHIGPQPDSTAAPASLIVGADDHIGPQPNSSTVPASPVWGVTKEMELFRISIFLYRYADIFCCKCANSDILDMDKCDTLRYDMQYK
jgi:hypothetical protein